MTRAARVVVAACAMLGVLLSAASTGATSSALLKKSDLPAGYGFGGPATHEKEVVAKFPSVAGTRNTFGIGGQSVWTFAKKSAAEALFTQYERALVRLPECTTVTYDEDDDDTTPPTPLGTYRALDIGQVGDERAAVVLGRTGTGATPRTAMFREGSPIVLLQVADADLSSAEFRDLAMAADDRAAAA